MAEPTGDLRRSSATATLGLGGVGGAAMLRHRGLERAYGSGKRPPLAQELKFLRRGTKGRLTYGAGALIGTAAVPTAAVGINHTAADLRARVGKRQDVSPDTGAPRRSFLREGVAGARDAITSRNDSLKRPAPVKLQVGNYLAGAAVGSGTGALTHRLLRHRVPGTPKAAAAAMAGITAGTLALPAQSAATRKLTHGKYEVTPTGVRRVGGRRRAKRPSAAATIVGANGAPAQPFGKRGEGLAARWSTELYHAASRLDGTPIKRGKLVRTAQLGMAGGLRSLSTNASPLAHLRPIQPHVAKYYGQDMSHREKRLRVQAVGGPPIIGDLAQAAQAGRMAPPPLQRRTAAAQYGGNVGGGAAGQVGGAALALAAARRSAKVQRGAEKVTDAQDRVTNYARAKVGMTPRSGPSATERGLARVADHARTPRALARGLRAVGRNPKVAAAGALVGGAVGGTAGGQAAYGAMLRAEDRYKAQHGIGKADAPLTRKEKTGLAHTKTRSATLSQLSGATGLGALTALGVSRLHPKLRRVRNLQTPLLTAGAGIGGANAFLGARVQRKEAEQLAKAYLPVSGLWKPTSELSAMERHQVRATARINRGTRERNPGRTAETRGLNPGGRTVYRDAPLERGQRTPRVVVADPGTSRVSGLQRAGHAQPNGTGGGLVRLHPDADRKVLVHELAHTQPRRNPYATQQRLGTDPVRHGREEGRADYLAHGRTPGRYPGGSAFQRGYDEVQERMAAAGTKVRKGLLPTGVRRAPVMRVGTIRQTRLRSGVVRTSTVRGGLA